MGNNKQGSVELLAIAIYEKFKMEGNGNELNDLVEQAKAMHKEEMKQTYFDGWHRNIGNRDEDFDDYYNKTFGGNNEQQ